jgi:HlyD family secretion protein
MKRAIIALVIIAAIGAGAGAYYVRRGGSDIQVNTSPLTRGDITDTVGATGTLQAVTTVQVGSQVSGNISYLGADFNSIVKKGQVIAKLDPSLFDAQLQQARANLGQSQASLAKAKSDLERAKVQLIDSQQKYTRTQELAAKKLLPQSDLDAAKIAVDTAQAMLQSAQATVTQSEAAVTQSQASVNQNQVNLQHTVITAPIDGIVIQRSVDVGQTVAASMQAPTLFIIAADLTKMQVNANIDEADVGRIRPSQTVTFRVDAYPTEDFSGSVEQIRLQPVVVQNVTTYATIIDVPNPALKLKPGMTANLKVQIAKRSNVLRVPNAALRFRPNTDVFAALNQPVPPEAQTTGGAPGRGGRGGRSAGAGAAGAAAAAGPAAPSGASAAAPDGSGAAPARSAADTAARHASMLTRFKAMTPDEQTQALARMKERGMETADFEKSAADARAAAPAAAKAPASKDASAQTIDALFAPLQTVESQGRAWVYMDKQMKPVRLRLGITDGTNTELLSGELQPNMEVVTGVIMSGARTTTGASGSGNPLIPQRGGPGRGR